MNRLFLSTTLMILLLFFNNNILNSTDFYIEFSVEYETLFFLAKSYLALDLMKLCIDTFYINFLEENKNLIQTESNYFLLIQLFNFIYNFHNSAIAILLFVGNIYMVKINKMTNIWCYVGQLVLMLFQASFQWYKDKITHDQNNEMVYVIRKNIMKKIYKSMICNNDILVLCEEMIPVTEGIVTNESILLHHNIKHFKNTRPNNKFAVNNLSQTGEDVTAECKPDEKVYFHQEIISKGEYYVTVKKTESERMINVENDKSMDNLIFESTCLATIVIFIVTIVIYINTQDIFNTKQFIIELLGSFIGQNYLIPSFKMFIGLAMWNLCYTLYCKYYGFSVNNHGKNTIIDFDPETSAICSDKTGTLTLNSFDLSLQDSKLFFIDNIKSQLMTLLIAHIGGYYRNDKTQHLSNCMENAAILNCLRDTYNIKISREYIWTDSKQTIEYTVGNTIKNCIRHKFLPFKRSNNGSFSVIEVDNKLYFVFEGSMDRLSKRLEYKVKSKSKKRGWIVGMIPLNSINDFDTMLEMFQNSDKDDGSFKNNNKIITYEIIGEFLFNNYYRQYKNYTTESGIKKLLDLGYMFIMITGDNPNTAEYIGKGVGLNGPVIDGIEFRNYKYDKKIQVIESIKLARCGVFGNTNPKDKADIVELLQEMSINVVYLGDQDNDMMAIDKADLAIVQSEGNSLCKRKGALIANVPTEAAYYYLSKLRNVGVKGKRWFYKLYNCTFYITAAFWLSGMFNYNFEKVSILFNDPWDPVMSTFMSTFILICCILFSGIKKHTNHTDNSIIYYTPIIGYSISIIFGYILQLLPLEFTITSLPSIILLSNLLFVLF
jgi:hypothetical protein